MTTRSSSSIATPVQTDLSGVSPRFLARRNETTLAAHVEALTARIIGEPCGDELASVQVLERQLGKEAEGDFDFAGAGPRARREHLAAGLAQVLTEGTLDAGARRALTIALSRQAHPLVVGRIFEGNPEVRVKEVARLLEIELPERREAQRLAPRYRLYPRSVRSEPHDGPPDNPEVRVKEVLEGGERPGGATVSPAGRAHLAILNGLMRRLWEAGVGVDPARLFAICRGKAPDDGIDLFGGAVVALARAHGLDVAAAEAARAKLLAQGLAFELEVRAKAFEAFAVRVLVGLDPNRAASSLRAGPLR